MVTIEEKVVPGPNWEVKSTHGENPPELQLKGPKSAFVVAHWRISQPISVFIVDDQLVCCLPRVGPCDRKRMQSGRQTFLADLIFSCDTTNRDVLFRCRE